MKFWLIVSICGIFYYEIVKFLVFYLFFFIENEYSIKIIIDFVECLSNRIVDVDEVLVLYDVFFFFIEVLFDEIIDYIIYEIYINNKLL